MSWVAAAFVSAFFAGITSVLAKCGIKQTDSDVATAIRTCVVLVFAWAMAGISGSIGTIGSIKPRSWLFLVLSGLATGASWICYFKALGIGDVNKVVPVDKMSTVLAALIAIVLFGETSNLAVKLVGTAVITLGTFLMIEKKQSARPEQQQDRTWLAYALGAARVRGAHVHPCQGWHRRRRVKPGHGNPHLRGTGYGMGDRGSQGKTGSGRAR